MLRIDFRRELSKSRKVKADTEAPSEKCVRKNVKAWKCIHEESKACLRPVYLAACHSETWTLFLKIEWIHWILLFYLSVKKCVTLQPLCNIGEPKKDSRNARKQQEKNSIIVLWPKKNLYNSVMTTGQIGPWLAKTLLDFCTFSIIYEGQRGQNLMLIFHLWQENHHQSDRAFCCFGNCLGEYKWAPWSHKW